MLDCILPETGNGSLCTTVLDTSKVVQAVQGTGGLDSVRILIGFGVDQKYSAFTSEEEVLDRKLDTVTPSHSTFLVTEDSYVFPTVAFHKSVPVCDVIGTTKTMALAYVVVKFSESTFVNSTKKTWKWTLNSNIG